MLSFLHAELKKVLHSRIYRVLLLLLVAYVCITGVQRVSDLKSYHTIMLDTYSRDENGFLTRDASIYGISLYNCWIGGINGRNFLPTLFYLSLPLLCVLPYGASYFTDKTTGYLRTLCQKKGKTVYFFSKYAATFFSGFSLYLIPLIVNFILVACLVPAYKPDPLDQMYYAVYYGQAFAPLYYTSPLLYAFLYMLLTACFAGLWATVPLMLAFFIKNKYALLFLPYVFILFFTNAMDLISYFRIYLESSPLYFLRGALVRNANNGYIILAWLVPLFLITFSITMLRGKKDDIY